MDGDGVGVDTAEGFFEANVVGFDIVAELDEFFGDVAFGDGAEEVAFVVGVADEGDFDALEGCDELLFFRADLELLGFIFLTGGFEALDVAIGGLDGEALGEEVVAGEAFGDFDHFANDAGAFDGLGEENFHENLSGTPLVSLPLEVSRIAMSWACLAMRSHVRGRGPCETSQGRGLKRNIVVPHGRNIIFGDGGGES